jgi:predicted DNA-binding transcriptional regulator AlpA
MQGVHEPQQAARKKEIEPALIGKRECARLLGIGVSTLERYHAIGWVPRGILVGNALRWRLQELRDWIDAGAPRGR